MPLLHKSTPQIWLSPYEHSSRKKTWILLRICYLSCSEPFPRSLIISEICFCLYASDARNPFLDEYYVQMKCYFSIYISSLKLTCFGIHTLQICQMREYIHAIFQLLIKVAALEFLAKLKGRKEGRGGQVLHMKVGCAAAGTSGPSAVPTKS